MVVFSEVNEVIEFAVKVEKQEYEFYKKCADKTTQPGMKEVFSGFATEELSHMERLNELGKQTKFDTEPVKFGRFNIKMPTNEIEITEENFADFDYKKILKYAIKNETSAFNLYGELADAAEDKNVKGLLQELAREELAHKLKFEQEYQEYFG
jgi:rubrerythrin